MLLHTLADLRLEGSPFCRTKPLLLLTYLALEGSKSRRYLAQLFWPEAQNAMNSLSVALTKLRRALPEAIFADEVRVWAHLATDFGEVIRLLGEGRLEQAVALYRGPFLEGFEAGLGVELEEWLYGKREWLGGLVREALLDLAEREVALGRLGAAAERAERAYRLPGAAEPEPEQLRRLHALLTAGGSLLAAELRRYEPACTALPVCTPEPLRFARALLGREEERARLLSLEPGEWAWVHGAEGHGKSALLRALGGRYLPARHGLPYATLEPLLGNEAAPEPLLLRRLMDAMHGQLLLFDGWGRMDPESRALLTRVRALHPQARVVIASRSRPPWPVELMVETGPLAPAALAGHPGMWERSGGLPSLVAAALRGDPLPPALELRLAALDECAQSLYFALVLLESPDLPCARRALGLGATELAEALDRLVHAGLLESSMLPRARRTALELLQARPARHAALALRLARCLEGSRAYPLYRQARSLWEDTDLPAARAAATAWITERLRLGRPGEAVAALAEVDLREALGPLAVTALLAAGRYVEAGQRCSQLRCPSRALRAELSWRLGNAADARAQATAALAGSPDERAAALDVLAGMALAAGDSRRAAVLRGRAAALWAVSDPVRHLESLLELARARAHSGEDIGPLLRDLHPRTQEFPVTRALALLVQAETGPRCVRPEDAEPVLQAAAETAAQAGAVQLEAHALHHLGALMAALGRTAQARVLLGRALERARVCGETYRLAALTAALAHLEGDPDALAEAGRMLEGIGYLQAARRLALPLAWRMPGPEQSAWVRTD
ncbi:tetratricopeptide (TPR) repeat protein [Deinobacterium chartae]|uniref:Tetratricopeptide (TPR) repeat protein n=1 Tax=Deinobacterium chartae TaxID=521158 RepID=A0A841I197_9DEIO|nr:BTAD domain-containing putative transcriptional regulator [Deinobacterium chartae]MBB6097745.1 tetratricopeptide (TPR) repeat protein [Deinobacterium chartae]